MGGGSEDKRKVLCHYHTKSTAGKKKKNYLVTGYNYNYDYDEECFIG
jgi:hypothetical protein